MDEENVKESKTPNDKSKGENEPDDAPENGSKEDKNKTNETDDLAEEVNDTKKSGGNQENIDTNGKQTISDGDRSKDQQTTLAYIPEGSKTQASANIIIQERTIETENKREELIKKIEALERQKRALKQKQLIKEIKTLENEVQTNVQDETKEQAVTFEISDQEVIPNNAAPMSTEIQTQSKIDTQMKELNDKIERTSRQMEERKRTEDLSSLSTEELQNKIQELKHRKDLLSRFKQKAKVITLIQDLHKQVSTMKKNVKSQDDITIPAEKLKVFSLSPSEIDIYWNPSDFVDLKQYTLFYKARSSPENEFQVIKPEISQTSHVIENLSAGEEYDVKLEGLTNQGYRITTEPTQIKTFKPITGFALILANHSGYQLPHLKDLEGIPPDINDLKGELQKFSFDVTVEENLNAKEMMDSIESHSSKLDVQEVDCFLCVVTGYMYNGYVYGTDGVPVLLNKLLEPLRMVDKLEDGRPAVGEGKIKLIIVDAFKVSENIVEELDDSLQPRAVQFRSTSRKTIEASWKRPKLSKRKLKGFKLALKNTSTSQVKYVPFNTHNDNYEYKFHKLVPNTEYNLEISAEYDDSWEGKPLKATLTTFEPQFMQPRKLSVEAVSSSQVYVYWIPPKMTSRTILGYKVSIRDQTREEFSQKITSYTCFVFDDLKEDTEYNISITTIVKGEIIDFDTEVKEEESMPIYIDITTLKDRTQTIMSGPTVNYIIEEPDFYIASATASTTYDPKTSSFLNTVTRHISSNYEKKDIQSILEDVKREMVCSTDNYEIPQSVTTLRQPIFFSKKDA